MIRLNNEQLEEKVQFIRDYVKAINAADGSKLDANANVSSKNISTLSAEIHKDINIQIQRNLVKRKIAEIFGEELADEYIRQIETHEIYVNDESSFFAYCVAIDIFPFLMEGLKSLGGESEAPKHINSFCGSYVNLIFAISSQFAGAVADVSMLMVFDHFARKDYGDNYLETHTKEIENHLQHIIYAINQPAAARGYQAVFYNTSVFDKYYFNTMFGTFMFPDGDKANWESVKKLQVFFMKWFNKERTKALLTFPVVTAAMLTENGKPKDEEFADFVAEELSEGNAFFIYMSNTADSLSSCCFDGSQQIRLHNNGTLILSELKDVYDRYKDEYIECYGIDEEDTKTIVKATPVRYPAPEYMYKIDIKVDDMYGNNEKHTTILSTSDHIHRVKFVHDDDTFDYIDIYTPELKVGDYLQHLESDKYAIITCIEKVDYDEDYVYCLEVDIDYLPYFTLDMGIVTHNCRLRNDISDQLSNEFSYTLGGTGVSTGSINVITINMNRLIQDNRNLEDEVKKVHKYQYATRKLIEEYKEAGMLPVYDAGYVNMDKQYLTIGINGIVEAAEFLGFEISNNEDYMNWLAETLGTISELNKEAYKTFGYKYNTEIIPAENCGAKNAKWDKRDGYKVPRDVYNSYFYKVEDDSVSLLDKFELHGEKVLQYLDGGSALHGNLEEYPTKEGFKKLLNVAAVTGCNYFCFNIKVTVCETCGYIDKQTKFKCDKCGSKDISHATRVIGYLKKIKHFSEARRDEEALRHYHKEKR